MNQVDSSTKRRTWKYLSEREPGIPHYKLLQIKFSETTAIRNKKQDF